MSRLKLESGVALVAVLWLVALLTMLAVTVVTLSVTHGRLAARYVQAVQADLTLDAAIRVVMLQLIAPQDRAPPWPIGKTQAVNVLGGHVEVTVQREAGRIDLNTADPDLLTALFAANGWRESDARSMAARIVDWRDPEEKTDPPVMQSPEYRSAHLSYGPHHGLFESVGELRQVLGSEHIGSELYDSFTVFTHLPGCIESVATPAVNRALAWADQQQLGGHRWLSGQTSGASPAFGAISAAMLSGEVVRLRACSDHPTQRCRVAIVRLTGNVKRPVQVFEWRGVSTTP